MNNSKKWKLMSETPPYEGYTGIVLINSLDGKILPKEEYWTEIGTFCDGEWLKLDYDEHLGILRKVPIHGKVYAYARYLVPSWEDEL